MIKIPDSTLSPHSAPPVSEEEKNKVLAHKHILQSQEEEKNHRVCFHFFLIQPQKDLTRYAQNKVLLSVQFSAGNGVRKGNFSLTATSAAKQPAYSYIPHFSLYSLRQELFT